ncbi:unnamed protein product [Prorocentrum cordatum]|uniref:Uncharacterized protein n=1 Tax=Prorocentrum cordatum TaxID=2364126 RepID=A0ABN9SZJ7_9DINO|nr:unnamed protein product [Polarella glacialis]
MYGRRYVLWRGLLAIVSARGLFCPHCKSVAFRPATPRFWRGRWGERGCAKSGVAVALDALRSRLTRPHGCGSQASSQHEGDSAGSAAKQPEALPKVHTDSADQFGPASFEPPVRRAGADLSRQAPEEIAEEAALLLATSSLSSDQQLRWRVLSAAVRDATPAPGETSTGPPPPEVLWALRAAREERDAFVASLGTAQREEVGQLLRLEKRERRLRSAARHQAQGPPDAGTGRARAAPDAAAARRKEVMTKAFWLFQQDRRRETGSVYVDSTDRGNGSEPWGAAARCSANTSSGRAGSARGPRQSRRGGCCAGRGSRQPWRDTHGPLLARTRTNILAHLPSSEATKRRLVIS